MSNEITKTTKTMKATDFVMPKYEIVVGERDYVLELNNESLRMADKMNFLNKVTNGDLGILDRAAGLFYIYAIKNYPHMTTNLAEKCIKTMLENDEDITEFIGELFESYVQATRQVFTSTDTNKKKTSWKKV